MSNHEKFFKEFIHKGLLNADNYHVGHVMIIWSMVWSLSYTSHHFFLLSFLWVSIYSSLPFHSNRLIYSLKFFNLVSFDSINPLLQAIRTSPFLVSSHSGVWLPKFYLSRTSDSRHHRYWSLYKYCNFIPLLCIRLLTVEEIYYPSLNPFCSREGARDPYRGKLGNSLDISSYFSIFPSYFLQNSSKFFFPINVRPDAVSKGKGGGGGRRIPQPIYRGVLGNFPSPTAFFLYFSKFPTYFLHILFHISPYFDMFHVLLPGYLYPSPPPPPSRF